MKRSILLVFALTLIGSSAFAQLYPSSYGGSLPSSNSPTVSNPPTVGSTRVNAPTDVSAAYGTSSGVQNIRDPYGTAAADARFGTSPVPPAASPATQQNNFYPYGVLPR